MQITNEKDPAGHYWLVNNRYRICKDDGCIYDTEQAKDIPQEIFDLRDQLLFNNK
jgi:hypothetical protein